MSEKHKNRSSWLFSQSLDRRNTSSMNELGVIAARLMLLNSGPVKLL